MKLRAITSTLFEQALTTGQIRKGIYITLEAEDGRFAIGEAAPLPSWSFETLPEVIVQFEKVRNQLLGIVWNKEKLTTHLLDLHLYPSLLFALETALLELLDPISPFEGLSSALLMGSKEEILNHAALRAAEGYTSAKLKISNLTFTTAKEVIDQLKSVFKLRIDVNRAWEPNQALDFFQQFPLNAFDYVEEPFKDPRQLFRFTHPLAIDESFPHSLTFTDLEKLPTLKTVVYKPTLQGGMSNCLPLLDWARPRGIEIVLSSSFETKVGLKAISSLANRLGLTAPSGLGTSHFLHN